MNEINVLIVEPHSMHCLLDCDTYLMADYFAVTVKLFNLSVIGPIVVHTVYIQ